MFEHSSKCYYPGCGQVIRASGPYLLGLAVTRHRAEHNRVLNYTTAQPFVPGLVSSDIHKNVSQPHAEFAEPNPLTDYDVLLLDGMHIRW